MMFARAHTFLAVCASAMFLTTVLAAEASPALIPRAMIFGNPSRDGAQVSPDGKMLAFLAPRDGAMNVWVAPTADPNAATVVTNDHANGIWNFWWTRDSAHILYRQDTGGDENWKLYVVDIAGRAAKPLSPDGKVQARLEMLSISRPATILIGLNDRDPRLHDIYRVDLTSGERTLVLRNDGYTRVAADDSLNVRLVFRQTSAGGTEVLRLGSDGKPAGAPLLEFTSEDALQPLTSGMAGFDTSGTLYYVPDSRGRDKLALSALDVSTGKTTMLAEPANADVQEVLRHPLTGKVQAVAIDYLQRQWQAVDPEIASDIAFLDRESHGSWRVRSRSDDDELWTVMFDGGDRPVTYQLYERRRKKLRRLFSTRPELERFELARMRGVEIKARDGLVLPSYVALPPGSDSDGDGVPDKPLPLVLDVHGGPWARVSGRFTSIYQWFANRGYAVLTVNYRGSTGFGKAFMEKARHEFAGKMHDDLIDAVDWAIQRGIADPRRVAIHGVSFGGYATLVGLTFTPEKFACGVDIVGFSNVLSLIESFPPYWEPVLEPTWYRYAGDPRTPDGRKLLLDRSPLTRVENIKRPLLIGQGANDPRVTRKESDQIVAAMQARDIPVIYAIYPDEGHGFDRPENRLSFFAISESFLGKCLGGHVEPIGGDLARSSLQIQSGAAQIPGLDSALGAR